jgi:hypothetical protein
LRNELRQETYNVHKQDGIFEFSSRDKNANNKADTIIKKIKEFTGKTDSELFKIFNNRAELISRGKLEDNIKRMILKMQNNEGGEYSHTDLTNAVIEHENTVKFISEIKKYVIKHIKLNISDISTLKIQAIICPTN